MNRPDAEAKESGPGPRAERFAPAAGMLILALAGAWRLWAIVADPSLSSLEGLYLGIFKRFFFITGLLSLKTGQAPGYFLLMHGMASMGLGDALLRGVSAAFSLAAAWGLFKIGRIAGQPGAGLAAGAVWLAAAPVVGASAEISPLMAGCALVFWAIYFGLACAASDEPGLYSGPFVASAAAAVYFSWTAIPILGCFLLLWRFWPANRPGGLNPMSLQIPKSLAVWLWPALAALALQAGHLFPQWRDAVYMSRLSGLAFPLRAGSTLLSANGAFGGIYGAAAGALIFLAVAAAVAARRKDAPQVAILAATMAASSIFMGIAGFLLKGAFSPALGVIWAGPSLVVLFAAIGKTSKPALAVSAAALLVAAAAPAANRGASDPNRPGWRAATSALNENLKSGEAVVAIGEQDAAVIRHYLKPDIEFLVFPASPAAQAGAGAEELLPLAPAEAGLKELKELFARYEAVWLIARNENISPGAPHPVQTWLNENTKGTSPLEADAPVQLYRLVLSSGATRDELLAAQLILKDKLLEAYCAAGSNSAFLKIFDGLMGASNKTEALRVAARLLDQIFAAAKDGREAVGDCRLPDDAPLLVLWLQNYFSGKGAGERFQPEADMARGRLESNGVWSKFWNFESLPESLKDEAADFAAKEDARLADEPDSKGRRKDIWKAYLQIEPGSVQTMINLAKYYYQADCPTSERYFQGAVAADPDNEQLKRLESAFPCAGQ